MILFIKCTIVNPTFDSQSKETLTTPSSKFGSKAEISEKFIANLYKTGIADKILEICAIHEEKSLKKTDGKKRDLIRGLPKLEDANWAGTNKSKECLLLLCEGDSAASSAISGLVEVGRDKYGVFPLKGKVMNVKDISSDKIASNDEITNIKKILGLESGKKYSDINDLRYGGIMLMTDADVDGSHISGLIFNLFHTLWPTLIENFKFVHSLQTPIVKVKKRSEVISFYGLTDFENWKRENNDGHGWEVKYYKGLGTSNEEESKEYFKKMKKTTYIFTENSNENLDLAFNKKRADDRKQWLSGYDRQNILDYNIQEVTYEDYINKGLIHFSNYDVQRSIPSMIDGLKISQRKILFSCFKRNLTDKEIRVAQLASYVSEQSAYHHGEASLQGAIVAMAQDFVGSNNINLLKPNGQFGCLAPNTEILMWDSSIKKAKDIVIGDKLIGDDEKMRTVLKLTNGIDDMYEITMSTGNSYTVNSQHILTLKQNGNIIDVKLTDLLTKNLAEYSAVNIKISINISIHIKYIGKDEFYGWQVDGNERFLLGDFTVTHNSRLHGGSDAAQPRYIHTLLTDSATLIYKKQDSCVLNYLDDDGLSVEPEHYIPILPMILVNGAIGIGTGFSTSIPSYNPLDIVKLLKKMLSGEYVDAESDDLLPWYKDFKGTIKVIDNKVYSIGCFKKLTATKIEITELPIGYWTFDFKADLENALDKYPDFKKYENKSCSKTVHFILHFTNVDKFLNIEKNGFTKLENDFKLVTSKNLGTTNMYAFNEKGAITKYESPFDVINQFYDVRLEFYKKRKTYILDKLQYDADLMSNKIRFIKEVVAETIIIHKMKKSALESYLSDNNYKKHEDCYDYIIRIPVYNLTIDKVEELEKDITKAMNDIDNIQKKTVQQIWIEELDEFMNLKRK
jgi:hypothetical protein